MILFLLALFVTSCMDAGEASGNKAEKPTLRIELSKNEAVDYREN